MGLIRLFVRALVSVQTVVSGSVDVYPTMTRPPPVERVPTHVS